MLPRMKYKARRFQRDTVRLGGYNNTPTAVEGELKDSKNITVEYFPYLAVRRGRVEQGGFARPYGLFAFNGLVVASGNDLYYNNKVVGTIDGSPKQFAVVNNNLIIYPDMLMFDLAKNTLKPLSGKMTTAENAVTFGTDDGKSYLDISAAGDGGDGSRDFPYTTGSEDVVKVYTSVSWDNGGGWTKTPAEGIEYTVTALSTAFSELGEHDKLYIIPYKAPDSGAYVIATKVAGEWTGVENSDGVFFELTNVDNQAQAEYKWGQYNYYTDTEEYKYSLESGWEFQDRLYIQNIPGNGRYGYSDYTTLYDAVNEYYRYNYAGSVVFLGFDNSSNPVINTLYVRDSWPSTGVTRNTFAGYIETSMVYDVHTKTIYTHTGYDTYYYKGSTFYGYVYGQAGSYPANGSQGNYWYVNEGVSGYNGVVTVGYNVHLPFEVDSFLNNFKEGDVIKISGCETIQGNNKDNLVVFSISSDRITFTTEVLTDGTEAAAVSLERVIPEFDFIASNGNRLWGVNKDGIFASAWADPANFYKLSGLANDSYFTEVGSSGKFTGICSYSGDVLCFKEDKLYRVFGDIPSDFSVKAYDVAGLQDGCHKSFAVINETLFYKGKEGIYAYTGSFPQLISAKLGLSKHFNAVGGDDGTKYYVSMQNLDGQWRLFVYDTVTGLWTKEDEIQAMGFAYHNSSLHLLEGITGRLIKLNDAKSTEKVKWEAEFATFYGDTLSKKTHNRIFMRVDVAAESFLEVYVQFGETPYKRIFNHRSSGRRTINIPIPIMRCDCFTLKLTGEGEVKIMAMEREFILGSEY